ncbi:MAG TPA: NAD-dependent epimerase/dehydratase family protein, partial [Segetibacter sp.]
MNINEKKRSLENNSSPLGAGSIIITGAAGFIGSCLVKYLNEHGYENLVLVDDFGVEEKRQNWENKKFETIVERYNLFDWLIRHNPAINFVIHLGARTDTTEFDYAIHQELNVEYSQNVWDYCTAKQVPLIYASSAATYGGGETGYDDNEKELANFHPLNPYVISKNEFDKWALQQKKYPPFWAGLKFFNVYGPNEYHKGRMASVIFHAFNQIKKDGVVRLFKSHKQGFEDGKQLRDFIYVKDVVKVIAWMMEEYMLMADSS